uniref:Hexosyltransferase n=1 Tax=Crassostrea virginica TaxID=6565 RepID=A0A8B8C9K1_CRAVI|nr:beta-1,3-galactosyltransferase 5-like [Crassostrea virginica]XP_022312427.1 beta-1,3-galactosyltransferase 5-like [Crassostrea virginica]XP_022312428.1 beta-1,3-galactosyltransferase 5-like [Crassostrea virginica]XP_022312429.1 beta-1,3-galactosyltransferase 5-like [Crassostrea virginica]
MTADVCRALRKFLCSPCGLLNLVYITATASMILLLHLLHLDSRLKALVPVMEKNHRAMKYILTFDTLKPPVAPPSSPPTFQTLSVQLRKSKRPDVCNSCFLHKYAYILDNDEICNVEKGKEGVTLLILISTTHKNADRRKALRETWLTSAISNTGDVRYAFLLGSTSDSADQIALETESATYRDIIQEDFIDSYNNLTLKTVMAFKWASTKCKHAKFFMKTDDDMFVNLNALKYTVKKNNLVLQNSIGGYCNLTREPIRSNRSKWSVTYEEYPHDLYPPYCSGTGYVTSLSVAEKVYQISKNIPFIYLEDVYVSLCMSRLGLNVTHITSFHADLQKIGCVYKSENLVTSHRLTPKMLRSVWNLKDCA